MTDEDFDVSLVIHGHDTEPDGAVRVDSGVEASSTDAPAPRSLTDSQLFAQWGPRCQGTGVTMRLFGEGRVTVHAGIADAVRALDAALVAHDYRTRAADTGAYSCRMKVGGNGWSIHSLKIALDINWTTNPYGKVLVTDTPPAMRTAIKAIRTRSGAQVWFWGGDWSGHKDAMHWQVGCGRADMASGIDPSTIPGQIPVPPTPQPTPPPVIEEDTMLIRELHFRPPRPPETWLFFSDGGRRIVSSGEHRDRLIANGYQFVRVTNAIDTAILLSNSHEVPW